MLVYCFLFMSVFSQKIDNMAYYQKIKGENSFRVNYGIVLQTKKIYLEYSRANISKEIKTLVPAGWAGVKIGWKLR
jgi:hypothetical protein